MTLKQGKKTESRIRTPQLRQKITESDGLKKDEPSAIIQLVKRLRKNASADCSTATVKVRYVFDSFEWRRRVFRKRTFTGNSGGFFMVKTGVGGQDYPVKPGKKVK